jgi:hypothetical protein
MELTSEQVQSVRQCMAVLQAGREVHAKFLAEKEEAVRELNVVTADRATVQTRMEAREKDIALSGAALPREPFPEEKEIALLDRQLRIHHVRVTECERRIGESRGTLEGLKQELDQGWQALGISMSESLSLEFCEMATRMAETRAKMLAVRKIFWGVKKAAWTFFPEFVVTAPRGNGKAIINPAFDTHLDSWPPSARTLLAELKGLGDQVKAAKEA